MKASVLRVVVPVGIGVVVAAGFALNSGLGNISSIGWGDISVLCPLGALTTMLAAKALVPRAVVSLVVALVLMFVLGRAFCGWLCPVPVVRRMPELFRRKRENKPNEATVAPLSAQEQRLLKHSCKTTCGTHGNSGLPAMFDSRHIVLLGTILSATIFGFPVFCLVCPIGLSFATLFLVITLFAGGDVTWSLVVVPVLLLLEVTVFKRWCSLICPLGALMSLVGRANTRTLQPRVDAQRCIEAKGGTCGRCVEVCEQHINVRDAARVNANECTKCSACLEACPTQAIKMPLILKK